MMLLYKFLPHQTSHILGRNNVVVKNSLILNIIHNIFNFRDTETVICVILVIFKRASGLKTSDWVCITFARNYFHYHFQNYMPYTTHV